MSGRKQQACSEMDEAVRLTWAGPTGVDVVVHIEHAAENSRADGGGAP